MLPARFVYIAMGELKEISVAKKRTTPRAEESASDAELAHTLREAAQHIWLAGLGALARTQEESAKVFSALKSEGRHTGRSARERVAGLTEDVGRVTTQAARGASSAVERLNQLFDARIVRTLRQLGVPTADDMRAVADRLDALETHTGAPSRKRAGARTASRAGGVKTVARKASPKSATFKAAAKKRPPPRRRVAG